LIFYKKKAFTVIEFLIASTLTVAVVASSTIGIGLSEKIQRDTYYSDTMNQIGNSLIEGSRALNCGIIYNMDEINNPCKASSLGTTMSLNSGDEMLFPRDDGIYTYKVSNTLYFEVKLNSRWLEAGRNNSCKNVNIDPSSYPQPNMLLRSFKISGIANGKPIKTRPKTFSDIQSVSAGITGIQSSTSSNLTYSAGAVSSGPSLITATLKDIVDTAKVIKIARFPDQDGCAIFPFIDGNVSVEIDNVTKRSSTGGRV
jgi:hypothetical protein